MRKFLLTLSILLISIIINGCSKTQTTKITFDNFEFNIKSKEIIVKEIKDEEKKIFENEKHLYKIFIMPYQSGFTDSLVIYKEPFNELFSLEKIIQININKLQKRFKGYKLLEQLTIKIPCDTKEITGYIQVMKINSITPKKNMYINQAFLIHNNNLYIISSTSENGTNSKNYKKGMKKIQCTKETTP